jgi:hypothetical protein
MSDLSLSSMKSGLSELQNLGQRNETFSIWNHQITIRTLGRPDSEEVQVKAGRHLEDSTNSNTMLPWLNAQRYETLSRAIIQIDEYDFRGVDTVQAGDGKEVDKTYAIQQILNTWNTNVVDACWQKYKDLEEKAKEDVFDQVEFLDREDLLDRHEDRVQDLRNQLDMPPLTPDEETEQSDEDMSEEVVKEKMFDPDQSDGDVDVDLGDVDELKEAEREFVERSKPTSSNPQESNPPQQRQPQPPPQEQQDIIDSDNPDRELSDEERRVIEAEEQAFQQMQQSEESDEPHQPIRTQRQQQRANAVEREPMNQHNPDIQEGNTPQSRNNESRHIDDEPAPDEEEFVDSGTQFLGPNSD